MKEEELMRQSGIDIDIVDHPSHQDHNALYKYNGIDKKLKYTISITISNLSVIRAPFLEMRLKELLPSVISLTISVKTEVQ